MTPINIAMLNYTFYWRLSDFNPTSSRSDIWPLTPKPDKSGSRQIVGQIRQNLAMQPCTQIIYRYK